MPEYRLLENVFAGARLGSLFQDAAFFRLHNAGQGRYFEWAEGDRVVASVHFTPNDNGLWRSPARGTFAGFAFQKGMRTEDLFAFYDAVETALKAQGAQCLEVLPAPMAHDPMSFANQLYLLRARGYQMTCCDLNQSLDVDERSLSDRMTYGNQKRLRKCQREGLVTEQLALSGLPKVYEALAANRKSKGHTMSMTLTQLQAMVESFPDAVVLFGNPDGDHLASSALCLRLSPIVLYVLYWGDRPGYASLSPVVSLASAIYEYCQAQGLQLLDAGTSTIDREPNFGLIRFKRGLGFTESLKVRMSKSL
jgi:hypothetical protein